MSNVKTLHLDHVFGFVSAPGATTTTELVVPKCELGAMTGLLAYLVPHSRFRDYSPCVLKEAKEGKINLYLGSAFRDSYGMLNVSSSQALVHFQYNCKGKVPVWQGSYYGMAPLESTDFKKVMDHVRGQISKRHNISLELVPAYVPPAEPALPYTHRRGGKKPVLRVV